MKHLYVICIIFLWLIIVGSGCEKKEIHSEKFPPCDLEEIIKSVSNTEGTIWYNSELEAYAIYMGIDGTYDGQDVNVICNLPEKYRVDGLNVVFSGNYYEYGETVNQKFPGQEYYYLEITDMELVEKD